MIENVIEIEDGAVFGWFPAGTLVRIVGRPAAPGRGCRSQRCQEFVLPDAASYGIDVQENGEYQVVREGLTFYPSTIGPRILCEELLDDWTVDLFSDLHGVDGGWEPDDYARRLIRSTLDSFMRHVLGVLK